MNKVLVGFLGLVLVGAIGFVWYNNKERTKNIQKIEAPQNQNINEPTSAGIVLEGGNAINIEEQESGDIALVNLAVLDKAGFVVIHALTTDGKPGEVIGHSEILEKGQNENIEIEVDPTLKTGQSYLAMLHSDNGDKDFGTEKEDVPLKDEEGNIISMKFTVKKQATLEE